MEKRKPSLSAELSSLAASGDDTPGFRPEVARVLSRELRGRDGALIASPFPPELWPALWDKEFLSTRENSRNQDEQDQKTCRGEELPPIWLAGPTSSSLDLGWELFRQGRLPVWGSVLALSQHAGRGQLRRAWASPPGNIYAALRLPLSPPFTTTAAAPAVGALLADALTAQGFPVGLKWPNDILSREMADSPAPAEIFPFGVEQARKEALSQSPAQSRNWSALSGHGEGVLPDGPARSTRSFPETPLPDRRAALSGLSPLHPPEIPQKKDKIRAADEELCAERPLWRKVGGILLEEREGALLAGIGLNVASFPPETSLREACAFPAGRLLLRAKGAEYPLAPGNALHFAPIFTLWRRLAEAMFSCYLCDKELRNGWIFRARRHLALRGCRVRLENALPEQEGGMERPCLEGVLEDLTTSGALRLHTDSGQTTFLGGSLSLLS